MVKDLQELLREVEEELKELGFIDDRSVKGKVTKEKANIIFKPSIMQDSESRVRAFSQNLTEKGYPSHHLDTHYASDVYGDFWRIKIESNGSKLSEKEREIAARLFRLRKDIKNYRIKAS